MKIPHLYEINPFDNTEKVYESISGYTVENWSSETLGDKGEGGSKISKNG